MQKNLDYIKIFLEIIKSTSKNNIYFLLSLLFLLLISTIFELASVTSIIPLIELLTGTSTYKNYDYFSIFFENKLSINKNQLIISFFLIFTVFSYFFKIFIIWFQHFVVFKISQELSIKIFSNTIHQEYSYYSDSSSNFFLGNIEKVKKVQSLIMHVSQIFISSILFLSILILIFFMDVRFFLFSSIVITFLFVISYYILKRKIQKFSKSDSFEINNNIKIIQDSYFNIREITLSNLHNFFIKKFSNSNKKLLNSNLKNILFTVIPGNIIMVSIIIIFSISVYILSLSSVNLISFFPLIGAMAFSLQKLINNGQLIYGSFVKFNFLKQSVIDVYNIIKCTTSSKKIHIKKSNKKINFKYKIELEQANFSYKNKEVFSNINLIIKKETSNLILGKSGVGKSTLVDLLVGFVNLQTGKFKIDNKPVCNQNIKSWQNKISYVSQSSQLIEGTILENLVFGLNKNKIKISQIKYYLTISEIFDFIENLPEKLNTSVGERGIKLSGGQRQRLLIARSLINNKEILVFDEATNAIDKKTEIKIYTNIINSQLKKTLIVISHRDSLAQCFKNVFYLKKNLLKRLK